MSKGSEKNKNPWSQTICLPKTRFQMKAELAKREPGIIEYWQREQVYKKVLDKRREEKAETFLLHDGPPYANGNFHSGHALNKILKDIIVKFQLIRGRYAPYVPGWDCHGLPIELAVMKKLSNRKKGEDKDPIKVRQACRKYAAEFVKIQAEDQSRFGIFWQTEQMASLTEDSNLEPTEFYYTMSPDYEAGILEVFRDLFAKGYIYKGEKPVYWCPVTATAHAEAEVEYHEHTSPSIYVKFPVEKRENTYVVIWTTTPWTLPANLAVCFNPDLDYKVYTTDAGRLIIAEGLEEKFFSETGLSKENAEALSIDEIRDLKVKHPFIDRESLVTEGRHVTLEAGTGVVHTAPGHGIDDYQVGLRYNLEPYSPVDHRGRFTEDVPELKGMKIHDANPEIIKWLREKNLLIHESELVHSYPHSWRSHAPLMMRATPQWFFRMDDLREKAVKAAEETQWIPEWGLNRFRSMVENRPDWCLSRQRHWGVPIPAFACEECGSTHINHESLNYIIEAVRKDGIEVWFDREASELIKPGTVCENCGSQKFRKESDILDVWFDSGISWYSVLKANPDLDFPADIYLEGSDQHRGWFQSSLWPSLALNDRAPFRQVLTHGYVLDEKGRAMSKSLGNGIMPGTDIIPKYGADILRLWVSSEDYRTDNRIGFENLKQIADSYRKIRNTFRYILGNLHDTCSSDLQPESVTDRLDRYILNELSELGESLEKAYSEFEFHTVFHRTVQFCTLTLSNLYFEIVRDRLYCDAAPDSDSSHFAERRNSTLNTLNIILHYLKIWLAPVLSFTAEEVHRLLDDSSSIFEQKWESAAAYRDSEIKNLFEPVFKLRDRANAGIEELRQKSGEEKIGSSNEARVILPEAEQSRYSEFTHDELAAYLVVSEVAFEGDVFRVEKARYDRCPRCWRHTQRNTENSESELCGRCYSVIG